MGEEGVSVLILQLTLICTTKVGLVEALRGRQIAKYAIRHV